MSQMTKLSSNLSEIILSNISLKYMYASSEIREAYMNLIWVYFI